MPVTPGAFQTTSPNGYDFYLMSLSANMSSLLYGSYFGGNMSTEHVDGGTSRFDKKGIMYQSVCAGCGGNDDFPVTPGAWPNTPGNPNHAGNCNNGVFKFDFQPNISASFITPNPTEGCAPLTVNFYNTSVGYTSYSWYFGPGDTTSTVLNPIRTFTAPGIYTVTLVVKDATTCNGKDSSVANITVYVCTGIQTLSAGSELKIYPNPSTGVLFINSESIIREIEIHDILGNVILKRKESKKDVQLDLGSFLPGVYFINVKYNDRDHIMKFVKE
jgi:hypothetical protein